MIEELSVLSVLLLQFWSQAFSAEVAEWTVYLLISLQPRAVTQTEISSR